jgi:mannose-6-phosphate isomerase-like protein (cupin superfamily)
MKGYVHSIEKAARQNATFRTVLYTAKNCQLVVMSLKPGEDIGAEVHKLDQFFRVEEGEGKAVLDGIEHRIKPGFAILVPRWHSPQHHQRPVRLDEALHALRSAEPSRWRSARHQGGRRGRQRAFRRKDDRIEQRLPSRRRRGKPRIVAYSLSAKGSMCG